MRYLISSLLAFSFASLVSAQQPVDSKAVGTNASEATVTAVKTDRTVSVATIGPEDVVSVIVYDSPDLSHNFRVDENGAVRLPLVRNRVQAAGLTTDELEIAIAKELTDEQLMVDPIVTVSVAEFHSRPIAVIGAVRSPTTLQAVGTVTLFDAIARAGGLADNAGPYVLVSHPSSSATGAGSITARIPTRSIQDPESPESNIELGAGDTIRIPAAGQIYVAGNVKRPGPFSISNNTDMTVLRALSIAGGLDSYASSNAYIYRADVNSGHNNEIPVNVNNILSRKSPDVPLYADDTLYIPTRNAARNTMKTLGVVGAVAGVAGLFVWLIRP
jgi:polysaccharide export outer membrane protein